MASILLVEDNDDHAILAQAALSGSDQMFQVERAASADECLAMLGKKSYDAIVLDYSLPKKTGLEILQDIKEIPYDAPVVMITSHGDEQVAVEAMKRGAYDYVSKSEDYLAKLPLVLQKAIEAHEMARERAELQAQIEESENRLKTIFEHVEVGLIKIGDGCNVSYANPKAKHYLNVTGEPQDIDICAVFSVSSQAGMPVPPDCAGCIVKHCFETGESISCEMQYNDRKLSVAITAIRGSDNSVKQLVTVLMDVTEQRKLQQQLIQSERIGVLGRMASGVAHDFNNILAAILGRVELMLLNPGDREGMEKGLRAIQAAALDGADTVRRIQEFTGVARQQKEFAELKVNDIIRDVVSMTEPRWKDQPQRDGIRIDISMDLNSRQPVAGNASDLREVLTNLIFNAVDAMPNGGGLSFETYDEGNNVCISISDTGIGIPSEVIGSVFEPFFTSKGVGHTGLGLSVAYGIISRHGGRIDVDSAHGKGTTFIVRLPAHVEMTQREKAVVVPSVPEKANVLVIDDEETIRDLLTSILVRFNHDVTAAVDGTAGIRAFRTGNYDIVFTDLGMPGISGWEVAQRIKAVDPSVTVVLITGWGIQLDEIELKERKIDSVISKPFQIKQILEMVSKALE
jgi:signal transduction histidine kinase/CheY-like chemotaxis protein